MSNVGSTSGATGAYDPYVGSPTDFPANPGGKLGKNEFLKLLVAQLRNQDPTNPVQGDQMAAQLAQFSTVEQLTNMSEALGDQTAFFASMLGALEGQSDAFAAIAHGLNSNAALGALGQTVVALGNQVVIPAEGSTTVRAEISDSGGTGTLKVFDSKGREVVSQALGELAGGRQSWEVGAESLGLEPGLYTYAIEVTDAEGKTVPTQTFTVGRVDGVQYDKDGPVLRAGALSIPFGSVVEILSAKPSTSAGDLRS